jgi:hypothetical protein
MLRVRMMNPPPQKENSSANLPIYWEMSRGASGCMGMFDKSVEEIWRGAGKSTAATALRGIVSQTSPAGLSCGAPLALGNTGVPVLPAEEQISDFARADNATGTQRRGIQGIEIGAKIFAAIAPLRASKRRWCYGPDDNLHLRISQGIA